MMTFSDKLYKNPTKPVRMKHKKLTNSWSLPFTIHFIIPVGDQRKKPIKFFYWTLSSDFSKTIQSKESHVVKKSWKNLYKSSVGCSDQFKSFNAFLHLKVGTTGENLKILNMIRIGFSLVGHIKLSNEVKKFLLYLNSMRSYDLFH